MAEVAPLKHTTLPTCSYSAHWKKIMSSNKPSWDRCWVCPRQAPKQREHYIISIFCIYVAGVNERYMFSWLYSFAFLIGCKSSMPSFHHNCQSTTNFLRAYFIHFTYCSVQPDASWKSINGKYMNSATANIVCEERKGRKKGRSWHKFPN